MPNMTFPSLETEKYTEYETGKIPIIDEDAAAEVSVEDDSPLGQLQRRYVKTCAALVTKIDEMLVLVHSKDVLDDELDKVLGTVDPVVLLHGDNDKDPRRTKLVAAIDFFKHMLQTRLQVLENISLTMPILKAIHLSGPYEILSLTREMSVVPQLRLRDQLAKTIAHMSAARGEKEGEVASLVAANAVRQKLVNKLMDEYKELKRRKLKSVKRTLHPEDVLQSKASLAKVRLRTAILSEFLTTFIASSGLDWGANEQLCEIVLFCGEEPDEET
ncbi:hypothetical protein BABINDRAFT_166221 [Babjeviella inositovora NRRL Y-12698]|uniref:Centromere protein H C-terminal domain-containing protein n=1 Tax=Babjeviella inositovora NRRL Y-12698 TaxID=984486 RepID=A0A1E3QSD0_9ASCO|nr:uncharacterized protein BABINDRAFT_166221 [Babjeviella inositovora NRRL Y-12698]ODQ80616.1 hypothetical protein BABINDRAFT_166221 [Babjeviella inositovora NRRL Y-12698]